MDDNFTLPVTYMGRNYNFPAQLLNYGYSYKLQVDIDGTNVLFEPDEERNWRALISYEDLQANKKLNPSLLQAIALVIDEITK